MKNKVAFTLILIFISLEAFTQGREWEFVVDPNDSVKWARVMKMKKKYEAKGDLVRITKKDDYIRSMYLDDEVEKKWTNQKLLDFNLTDIEGNAIDSRTFGDKNIHLNLWSTTCKPCIEEFPELNQLKEESDGEWVFIAMAPEGKEKVDRILSLRQLDYITIPSAEQYFEEIGVEAYPVNLFVRKGVVYRVIEGTTYSYESGGTVPNNYETYKKTIVEMNSLE